MSDRSLKICLAVFVSALVAAGMLARLGPPPVREFLRDFARPSQGSPFRHP